jgi:hypothetical protein
MARRRTIRCAAVLSLSLLALALWSGRSCGQGTTGGFGGGAGGGVGGGAGGSTGTGATAIGGGFTGGGGGPGGGYTGGTASGTGATMATGGFTGGSTSGSSLGFTGGGGLTSGAGTNVPSSVSPFISTYANPLVAGMVNTSGQTTLNKAFGQPMFSTYSTAISGNTTSSFGGIGGTGGNFGGSFGGSFGGAGGLSGNTNFGFNTFGMTRTPNYAATLADDMPRVVHPNPQLQANIADILRRSTYAQSTTPLRIAVKDSVVFIEGAVPTARQKRLIEGMIRLTPGVRDVVNNLEITETLPPPTKGP